MRELSGMMPGMKRMIIGAACAAMLAVSGCSSEPSMEEKRNEACDLFASLSPGSLEMQDAVELLADGDAPLDERGKALHLTLQYRAGAYERPPYDCDRPADRTLFEEHFGTFE